MGLRVAAQSPIGHARHTARDVCDTRRLGVHRQLGDSSAHDGNALTTYVGRATRLKRRGDLLAALGEARVLGDARLARRLLLAVGREPDDRCSIVSLSVVMQLA